MITGCLQQKNGFYYAVLYLKVNGRRRCKWVPMRLPVEGTSARKAQKAFDEIRLQYEREEEERLDREAKAKELAENTHSNTRFSAWCGIVHDRSSRRRLCLSAGSPAFSCLAGKIGAGWPARYQTQISRRWPGDGWG